MQKKRVVGLVLLLLVLCSLVGCKSVMPSIKEGSIYMGENMLSVTEWSGSTAKYTAVDYEVEFYICDEGPEDCVHNTLGVLTENMTKYKDAKYYRAHLDQELYLLRKVSGTWYECYARTLTGDPLSIDFVVKQVYGIMDNLSLTTETTEVSFDDVLSVNVSGSDFVLRQGEIVLKDLARVEYSTATELPENVTQSSATLGIKTVNKYTSEKYDYYVFDDITVQVRKGYDPMQFLVFKEGE